MAFDQTVITSANWTRSGADLVVKWTTSAPDGTLYQVYVNRRLAWSGAANRCTVPYPGASSLVEIDIGAVAIGEEGTSFADLLPTPPWDDRAKLEWIGGSYESDTLSGFNIYRGTTAGAAVSYASPIAVVAAYPQGAISDGFGVGLFGDGLFGYSAADYSWTSGPMKGGTWHFGVKPFDSTGNEGIAEETTVTITAPPGHPAANASGLRLTIAYDNTTHIATLSWLPSPG
jgi:hypothetical protein